MTDATNATTTDLSLRARVAELESRIEFLTTISSELVDILSVIVAGSAPSPLHDSLLLLLPQEASEVQCHHPQNDGENISQSSLKVTVSVTPPDVTIHSEPGAGHEPQQQVYIPSTTVDTDPHPHLSLVRNPQ
jgi:hypothetical protein